MRGDCSFCWYWWNWLPSLFKLSVHNHGSMILLNSWPWPHDYIHFSVFIHDGSPYLVYLRIICDTMSSKSYVICHMSPDDFIYTKYSTRSMKGARVAQWVRSLHLTTHTRLSPIRHGFAPGFVNYKKGCTRLASDKVYQLLAHGRLLRLPPPLKLVAMI